MWSTVPSFMLPLAILAAPNRAFVWQFAAGLQAEHATEAFDEDTQLAYRELVGELARRAAADVSVSDLVPVANALGLDLVVSPERMRLQSASDETVGAGVLAIRRGPLAAELVIAAPHPLFDTDVGWMASRIFDEAPVRAVFIATDANGPGTAGDPTLEEGSTLHLMTMALQDALEDPWFVQLDTYSSRPHAPAGVVTGGAAKTPRGELELAADLLGMSDGGIDVRTSRFVPHLGSRSNLQGQHLADQGNFLIVMLNRSLSSQIVRSRTLPAELGQIFINLADPRRPAQQWPPHLDALASS